MSEQRSSEMDDPVINDSEHSDIGIGAKMAASVKPEKKAPTELNKEEPDKDGASIQGSARAQSSPDKKQANTKLASTPAAQSQLEKNVNEVEVDLIAKLKDADNFNKTIKTSTLDRSNQTITYDKLKEFIKKNHPTKAVEKGEDQDMIKYFGLYDRIGVLPVMRCCNK